MRVAARGGGDGGVGGSITSISWATASLCYKNASIPFLGYTLSNTGIQFPVILMACVDYIRLNSPLANTRYDLLYSMPSNNQTRMISIASNLDYFS